MGKHLVLVGGGHAHMTCLKELRSFLDRGHRVTVVGPSDYHYYSGMGPGMLGGTYRPQDIRFHVRRMVTDVGATFVKDLAVRLDPQKQVLFLKSGNPISYDVISFNTGSYVPLDTIRIDGADHVYTVKPILNLIRARQAIVELLESVRPRILVVGGGPAGLEVCGNVWRLVHKHGSECILSLAAGKRLLAGFPQKVRRLALASLARRQIQVVEGKRVEHLTGGVATLENGRNLEFDLVFLALGVKPSRIFLDSKIPTGKDGGILLNPFLQSVAHPEIFGGGDCISFERVFLDKVGVYAVRENPVLYHNLMAALEGRPLVPFEPGGAYLLIFNLGDETGIFRKRNLVFGGKMAFFLKNYIDRKFMRKFQICGEADEKFEEPL